MEKVPRKGVAGGSEVVEENVDPETNPGALLTIEVWKGQPSRMIIMTWRWADGMLQW